MGTKSEKTIVSFGKYSDRGVFLSTLVFVLAGGGITVLWQDRGLFIWLFCLSFITLPVMHYLCREILRLRQRLQELEQHRS